MSVTKYDLVKALAAETHLSLTQTHAEDIIDTLFDIIALHLVEKSAVHLGAFGILRTRVWPGRTVANPTGEYAVKTRRIVYLKPSAGLTRRINQL